MQVPTVTLEDLQAFQATHFPGHPQTIYPPAETTFENDPYDDGEQADLGYYPDGVKRTLTDEQIRIFRHSEIHALLRERQLKEDDAEYEARRQESGGEDEPDQRMMAEENALDAVSSQTVQSGPTSAQPSSRKRQRDPPQPEIMTGESESLDYGDTDQASADKGQSQKPQPTQPRRKIVSYED